MRWFYALLVLLVVFAACGDDDDDDMLILERVDPKTRWIGSWSVDTIDGTSVDKGFQGLVEDDPDAAVNVVKNEIVFASNDTWF